MLNVWQFKLKTLQKFNCICFDLYPLRHHQIIPDFLNLLKCLILINLFYNY